MPEFNAEQLKKLVENQQWAEARELLEVFFHNGLTDEGDISLLQQTSAYLEAVNSLNRQHKEILDNALTRLKNLDKEEKDELDGIDLDITRQKIQNS